MKEMQETNRTTVLRVFFANDSPMTRGEIVEKTGLSAPTITRIVKELLREKIVIEVGRVELMQGRNRELLQIDYDHIDVLGFEINESFVHGVVCDLRGAVKMSFSDPVKDKRPQAIAGNIKLILDQFRQNKTTTANIIGIGVSISGIVAPAEQKVIHSGTMDWVNIHVNDLFPPLGDMRIIVENDANAALLGEVWVANIHDDADVVYIVINEGAIGASLLVDGQLIRGSTMVAGEISHFPVEPGGKLCACGNSGCFETYVSLERLEKEYAELSTGTMNMKLIDAYKAGDELAKQFVVEAAEKVSTVIRSIIYLVNPGRIIIGGLWIEAGDTFLDLVLEQVNAQFSLGERHIPEFAYSKLHPHAGVLGAVGLVIDEFLKY